MSTTWTDANVVGDTANNWWYQRTVDPDGVKLILELHFSAVSTAVSCALHSYEEPEGHVADDLEGCTFRESTGGLPYLEAWLAAGRTDQSVFDALAAYSPPAVIPESEDPTVTVAVLSTQNDDLRAQLEVLKSQLATAEANRRKQPVVK